MSSAEQDQWCEIAMSIRSHLAKRAEQLPTLKPEELTAFIKAADEAMWLEAKARTYDELLEQRRREFSFGG